MIYVMSDIHGEYEKYIEMIEKINLTDTDKLYVLGDVFDRGPHPIKVMLDIMSRPNVEFIVGNHEIMALECLKTLSQEITKQSIENLDIDFIEKVTNWQLNGGIPTIDEFHKLDKITQQEIIDFIYDSETYKELTVGDKNYILVHAGLDNFSPKKELWEYDLHELIWQRPDYEMTYFPDRVVITGHTPTTEIETNPRPGYIYQGHNHIAIDCGAAFGGKLACLCIDTMEELYI